MNSPQNILHVLKVWSLVLMVQGNELGLGFWFLCLKKREREGARKTRKKVSRCCVLLKSLVCFPWSSCSLFLPSFTLWRSLNLPSLTATYLLCYLRVMKSTLHADNHCIFSQAEEQHWLMSKIDCQVRQTGTCWVDIGGQSSDRKFGGWDTNSQTVKKIKCHETSHSSGSKNITWKGILLFLMNSVLCFLAKYFSSAL